MLNICASCSQLSFSLSRAYAHSIQSAELRAFTWFLNIPLPIHIFMCCNRFPHFPEPNSTTRMTMKIHQVEFHDQFVFSGPLVEIEKSPWSRDSSEENYLSFLFHFFFFLCCCSVWRERTDNKNWDCAKKIHYKRIKCLCLVIKWRKKLISRTRKWTNKKYGKFMD